MAAQERDDTEPTEGVPGEPEPAPEVGSDERAGAELDTARLEPEGPGGAQPPGVAEPPAPAGPGGPPAVGPGGTSVLPPVAPGGPPAPEQPRWAARAQVPTPRIEEYGEEWVSEPPRRLLVPVLLTICVMLLLGVFGFGIWLALSNNQGPTPTPTGQSSTPSPTTTTTTTTTTPPTTTTSPSPAGIQIPDVTGQEYEDAALTLAGLGLEPERVDRFSDDVPEGLVIATDPTPGSTVPAGQTILVFVSQGPEPTASPSATASPTTTGGDDD